MPSPPHLRGRCRPSRLTGRGTVRIAYEPQPRTPRRVCHRWVWSRPYQREAAPVLPIDTLRDWLELLYDADYTADFGRLAECTARIPAYRARLCAYFHVKQPSWAIPRAIIGSLLITTLFYPMVVLSSPHDPADLVREWEQRDDHAAVGSCPRCGIPDSRELRVARRSARSYFHNDTRWHDQIYMCPPGAHRL